MTFPYPRNRRHGPTYACLKEAEQEYLPKRPGEHGIILVHSLPESLVHCCRMKSSLITGYKRIYSVS